MGYFKYIEIKNFKSFHDSVRIETRKQFTAVIGPNGSGKSNLMDAISFVLGERASSLRVKRLSDLIHDEADSNQASVTAGYYEGEVETKFTRTVTTASSEYRINERVVSQQTYAKELEKLGIAVKAKNFLVFQGTVESIAMKNPKERTALLEEISRSGDKKEEYDRLKKEMAIAEEETQFNYQKKKEMAAERKDARIEKKEADRYQKLKDDLDAKQVQVYLFKLFNCETALKEHARELDKRKTELETVIRNKQKIEDFMKERKKERGKLQREMAINDQRIRESEEQLRSKRPAYIKAKEETAHMQKKMESAIKSLDKAKKDHHDHQNQINQLKKELKDVENAQVEFESQSQERNFQLEDSQVREYNRLKEEASKRSSRCRQDWETIRREQMYEQDEYEAENLKSQDLKLRLARKQRELADARTRLAKLSNVIQTNETSLSEMDNKAKDISKKVSTAKKRMKEINKRMEEIAVQIGDAKVDKQEDIRRKRKGEIVELLKKLYPGVYGRMVDMCRPNHQRYNIAIAKVLGKNMDAIVVDTLKTGRYCIQYLKDQKLEAETFLPLDCIDAQPLKGRLRNIGDPINVKLLFDLLQYEPPAIKPAVLYATSNVLVCETAKDANKVAYYLEAGNRFDAVALDGTYYQKNGFISGGSTDLKKRARRWDDKTINDLKSQKEKLTEELKVVLKAAREESELVTLGSIIKRLESRLKFSISDRDGTAEKKIEKLEKEIENLNKEIESLKPRIEQYKNKIDELECHIQEIKNKINAEEDSVFADFCESIRVENIREYEEKELQPQQERARKRLEFENQKYRLNSQLEYENGKDTQAEENNRENELETYKVELEKYIKAEENHLTLIQNEIELLEELKNAKTNKNVGIDRLESEMSEIREQLRVVQHDVIAARKKVSAAENKIERTKGDRHGLFILCKMDGIPIPVEDGSLDYLDQDDSDGGTSADPSSSYSTHVIYEREDQIRIDYRSLGEDLKYLDSPDEIKQQSDKFDKELFDMQLLLNRIQAPNMRVMERNKFVNPLVQPFEALKKHMIAFETLDGVRERFQETSEEFDNARKRAQKAISAFEKVKKERYDCFMMCFNHISNQIDEIYKVLVRNRSAQAVLGLENPEEPYLDGINYNCVAPGKRFQPMSNLSGGEKTMAALALLFAILSYQPAPLLVLDEIDAALDNTNIGKVASFIREQTNGVHCIAISLKVELRKHADVLVGIYPDVDDSGERTTSRVINLDLSVFNDY